MPHVWSKAIGLMTGQADEYVAKEPLIQFEIGKAMETGKPPIEAIHGWWSLSGSRASRYHLVLGKSGREIVGAFRPVSNSWREVEGKWGFTPVRAEDVWDEYVGKAVPDEYIGGQNPVRYVPPHPDHLIEGVFVSPKLVLYDKQNGKCNGCRLLLPPRNLDVDHVVAQSKGGSGEIENLQLLCGACNSMKGSKSQEEFLADLEARGLRC